MKGKVFIFLLALSLAVSGMLLCAPLGHAEEDTLTIGINVPLTGSYSDQGADELKAYKLAIDEVNAGGGLLGKRVVYVEKDSETNAQVSAKNAAELYDTYNAVMVTGGSASSEAVAQGKVAKEKGKVFMVCLSHSDATTGFEIDAKTGEFTYQALNRYMFRWYHHAWMSAHAASEYLINKFGKTAKYYYVTADYTWGHTVEKSFRQVLEAAGCQTIGAVRSPLGEKSFVKYLLDAKAAKPDVLVLVQFGKDMINSLKQATAMGIKKDLKIVVPLMELYMAKGAGPEAMEGVICTSPWEWQLQDKYPGSKNFVEKFKARYGTYPGNAAAAAWVAIMQYTDAVKKAGTVDAKAVVKALEGAKFTVLKGEEYWRDWDHQAMTSTLILEGKSASEMNGEWDLVKIIDEVPGEKVAPTKKDNPVKWDDSEKF
ncbi:MAG: substrate-binding protein [Candidatus Omnitrophota bacterium]|jgi:ABC-type branched-subunit amino acid transport system substrate-binding protein